MTNALLRGKPYDGPSQHYGVPERFDKGEIASDKPRLIYQICKKIVMLLMTMMTAFGARSETCTIDGITYTIHNYYYNGYPVSAVVERGSWPTGACRIPAYLWVSEITASSIPVIEIRPYAFSGCKELKSVTIPATVTSIGYSAFFNCSALESFSVAEDNPSYKSVSGLLLSKDGKSIVAVPLALTSVTIPNSITKIDDSAFSYCSRLKSIKIPDNITSIGNYAFRGCSGLTSVTIGNGVKSIEGSAFSGCSALMSFSVGANNPYFKSVSGLLLTKDGTRIVVVPWGLTSVTIPNSVTSIGSAFYNCSGLTSVTIPDSVTSIGDSDFYGCSGLTSVTIPDSVTSIGRNAFYNCSGLTSVTIPGSVTNISDRAFYGCSGLMSFSVEANNPSYKSVSGWLLTKDGTRIVAIPSGLTSLTIPNCVTSIGSAFYGCGELTSITIGNGVTSIEGSAFYNCTNLASVTIPDSVTSIGSSAFYNCTNLTSVTMPDGVKSIGDSAFYGCSGLTSVTIGNGVTSIGSEAFEGCSGLTSVTIPDNIIRIEDGAFSVCRGLTNVTIGAGVMRIGDHAFSGCSGLTSVTIGAGVMRIGDHAFSGCSGLTSVTIPDGVMHIGDGAFYGCSGLASVTIGKGVLSIGDYAFSGCSGIMDVAVPQSVCNNRLMNVFSSAYQSITNIVVLDGVLSLGDYVFSGCSGLASVTIPDSVTSIGYGAFKGCNGLASVRIPGSVTSIVEDAFSGCSGLASVTMSDGVTNIGARAFSDCSGLAIVRIPGSVTSIGEDAFSGCSSLTSMTIPDGVTNIGTRAFYGCSGLAIVRIPGSVTSIAGDAFSGCSGIKDVAVPQCVCTNRLSTVFSSAYQSMTNVVILGGVTSIEAHAFSGCSGLTSLTIPGSVTNIMVSAFDGCNGLLTIIVGTGSTSYKSVAGLLLSKDGTSLIRGVNGEVTIPGSVTSIRESAFSGCSGLTSVTIPDSVTSIGGSAFSGCSGLTSVTIPQCVCDRKLSSVFSSAYQSITNVVVLDSVTSIANSVFSGCSGLEEITLPFVGARRGNAGSKDSLFGYIFGSSSYTDGKTTKQYYSSHSYDYYCIPSSLRRIVITDETILGYGAFYNCSGLTSVSIPDGVTNIGTRAFYGCSGLASVRIPGSVTSIAQTAFNGCAGLMEIAVNAENPAYKSINGLLLSKDGTALIQGVNGDVIIPCDVASIGNSAFEGCSGLTSVTIPDSVTGIGESAFSGCSGLTSVTIGNGVKSIGGSAFEGCSGLTSVAIPNSVTSIKSYAFDDCSGLTSVHITDLAKWCGISFGSCANPLRYAHDLYLNGSLLTDLFIPDSVTSIESFAFDGYSSLTRVTIPNSVRNIGGAAFQNCSGLVRVTISDSVTSIGSSAFYNCSGLTSVAIPNSVTNIGDCAFWDCSRLTNVTIGNGVTSIGAHAFSGCSELSRVTIPDSVTSIGSYAFTDCSWLMSVTIPDGVTGIGMWTFYGCSGLMSVTIPDSVTSIDSKAFYGCSELTYVYVSIGDVDRVKALMKGSGFDVSGLIFIEVPHVVFVTNAEDVNVRGRYVNLGCAVGELPAPLRAGYEFAGWWTSPDGGTQIAASTVVTGNMTCYAHWTANKYTVTFDANGGSGGKSVTQDCGTSLSAPTVTREGFTFAGWSPSVPSTMPAGNATYTAQWQTNKYKVTFDANGGSGGTSVTQNYGTALSVPTVVRAGYTFTGWSPDIPATVPASNVTYLAQWKINQYSVTFDANGGNGGTSGTLDYGTALTAPTVTREGYTFMGWSPDVPATVPASNVTYTAQWKINQYKVTFDANGGVGMIGMTGSWILATNGWELSSRDSDGTTVYRSASNANGTSASMLLTLTGPYEFTFYWEVSDGCSYDYLSWYLDGTEKAKIWGGNRREDVSVSVPAGEHTVKWTFFKDGRNIGGIRCGWVRVPKITPYVSLDYGRAIGELPTPTRTGYTFEGWFTAATGGTKISTSTVVTGDMACYAHWTNGLEPNWTINSAGVLTGVDLNGCMDIVIPGCVTSIGYRAFYGCSGLTSVTIPDSVTEIGHEAFRGCSGLTSVTIPDSVTSIGSGAFFGCSWLTSVTIPNSVTSIGYEAFYDCGGLTRVTIPNSVTSIGDHAFSGCSRLMSVTIPDGVTKIGCRAFYGNGLTSVLIGSGVTSIGDEAFSVCWRLASVAIPDSVTSIGSYAFYDCGSLTNMTIGSGVTSIGHDAFSRCYSLKSVHISDLAKWCGISFGGSTANPFLYAENLFLDGVLLEGELKIPDVVTSIGSYAFLDCSGFTGVTIPDSVTYIGDAAFSGCRGLTSVTIPDSVTYIGDAAFSGCRGLTSVTIPDSVSSIGDEAFSDCSGLTSVTIPDSVTSIGSNAFSDCYDNSGLTSVTIPDSVTSIGDRAFCGRDGLTSVTIGSGVMSIGDAAFSGCRGLTSVTIPDSVSSIGEYAFSGCSGLTSVTIGNGVTSIGYDAFAYCDGLTSVTIPQCVCSASLSWVFPNSYRSIANVVISDDVTRIEEDVFCNCTNLASVTIGSGVTSIGDDAFSGCWRLTGVAIPNSVTSIGKCAFYNCSGLTNVTIGSGVRSVGYRAFRECSGLTSVTIPDSVTGIGEDAFRDCSGLTNVTIGSGVTSIGRSAFADCSGLTSVTIPDGVTSIGYDAFSWCYSLTSVAIPDSMTEISWGAFEGCSGLTSVTIPKSVTSIGSRAFACCNSLKTVTYLGNCPEVGEEIYYDTPTDLVLYVPEGNDTWADALAAGTWQDRAIRTGTAAKTYTVQFHKYDGSGETRSQEFKAGETKSLLWLESQLKWKRDGYEFIGWVPWNPDAKPRLCKFTNGEKVKDLAKEGETFHLWAAWKSSSSYRVCFNRNDGSGEKMNQVILRNKEDSLAWMDSQIGWTRPGYVFKGWAETATGAVKYANGAKVKNLAMNGGTKNLYAVWAVKSNAYVVQYHRYDGSGETKEQEFKVGEAKALLWLTSQLGWSREGYEFIGWVPWNPDAKARLCKYVNGQKVADLAKGGETFHLWAAWKSKSSFRVCFNRNDGSGVKMNQVILRNKEDTLAWLDSQLEWTREGYTFQGWAETATGAVKYANGAKVKNLAMNGGTKNLYAVWKAVKKGAKMSAFFEPVEYVAFEEPGELPGMVVEGETADGGTFRLVMSEGGAAVLYLFDGEGWSEERCEVAAEGGVIAVAVDGGVAYRVTLAGVVPLLE